MAVKRVSCCKLEKIAWSHQYGYHLIERGFTMLEHGDEADVQLALGYTAAMGAMLVDEVSRGNNWQLKFSQICQDIRDIKSNNYSSEKINNQKMTITSTQLGSTSILDNHKLPGSLSRTELRPESKRAARGRTR